MRVFFTVEAMRKLRYYVKVESEEISGLGTVEVLSKEDMLVTDVMIFKQKCTAADTDLDQDDVAAYVMKLIDADEDTSKVKLWWHSHSTMDVFWSSTDEATARRFGNGWMLSVVANKAGRILTRLDIYEPFIVKVDKIFTTVTVEDDLEVLEAIKAEVKEKVTHVKLSGHGYYNGTTRYGLKKGKRDHTYSSGVESSWDYGDFDGSNSNTGVSNLDDGIPYRRGKFRRYVRRCLNG
ncbi:MAG: hypothetical protein GY861_21325 [bacterium]|nr:hypothetical protein [bacterium]